MPTGKINALVPVVVDILTKQAVRKEIITYGDLAAIAGTHPRVILKVLYRVRDLCLENGWPPLTFLVVNKKSGLPGCLFHEVSLPDDASHEQQLALWQEKLNRIYSFSWNENN